ncbi:hypothetical protein GCM10007937_40260 [Mesorhizobium albiziae]|nr:hypothetical protein GCM10007937_40260 [Mesorhizobium albiziae]
MRIGASRLFMPDNNRIEQDPRRIKRRLWPMLGFKSTAIAATILPDIEMIHMMRQATGEVRLQSESVPGRAVRNPRRLIDLAPAPLCAPIQPLQQNPQDGIILTKRHFKPNHTSLRIRQEVVRSSDENTSQIWWSLVGPPLSFPTR